MLSKIPKSTQGESFWAKLRFRDWNDIVCINLCRELGVTPDVLRMIGGSLALTGQNDTAIAFTVMNMEGPLNKEQAGIVCMNANGGKLEHYQGKGKSMRLERCISRGKSGILNQHAITHWNEAEVIYKVEGISDMIVLQNAIPEELRDTHLVVTNSDGCDSGQSPMAFMGMIKGKNVIFIHDHDEPGQFGNATEKTGGAAKWEAAARKTAKSVLNLDLYPDEELPTKHGKDLRDWFAEGHTYDDLCEMANGHPGWWVRPKGENGEGDIELEPEGQNLDEFQEILRRLHLIVLGHDKNAQVTVFNMKTCRKFQIPDVDKFSYNKQLIHIGAAAREHIKDPMDFEAPEHLIDAGDVRTAISREAGRKELSRSNTVGIGLWESKGGLIAVGAGEYVKVNGGVEVHNAPMIGDKIVDFGEAEEAWYDRESLEKFLEEAKSASWRRDHLAELTEIFGQWTNHTHPCAAVLLSCLVLAAWGQSIWQWRPWIAIQGATSTGKSVLLDLAARYFGKLALATSDASWAGIRDSIGMSGRILLCDEFEDSKHRDEIVRNLMASSRKGQFGASVRSSSTQQAVKTEFQLMPFLSAIEMKRDKEAEENRYITFELSSRDGHGQMDIPEDPEQLTILRNKSIAVVLRCAGRIKELARVICNSMADTYTRQGESYALPCAVLAAVNGESDEWAVQYHRQLMAKLKSSSVIVESEGEQIKVLQAILFSQVPLGAGRTSTVADLLGNVKTTECGGDPDKFLNDIGIRRIPYDEIVGTKGWLECPQRVEASYVFMACTKNGQIRRSLLKDTDYRNTDIGTILSRIKGAYRGKCRPGPLAPNARGVFIPSTAIESSDDEPETSIQVDDDLFIDLPE